MEPVRSEAALAAARNAPHTATADRAMAFLAATAGKFASRLTRCDVVFMSARYNWTEVKGTHRSFAQATPGQSILPLKRFKCPGCTRVRRGVQQRKFCWRWNLGRMTSLKCAAFQRQFALEILKALRANFRVRHCSTEMTAFRAALTVPPDACRANDLSVRQAFYTHI